GNGANGGHLPSHRKARVGSSAVVAAPDDERLCGPMTPERWQLIKDVLAEALELPVADRSSCLDRRCSGDTTLRREVQLLLDRSGSVGSRFLNEPSLAGATSILLPAENNRWIGRRVGAYKTIEQIGAGGMGEVYRAFRADDQYRKEVALKVVRT